jgi:hypothetical protein
MDALRPSARARKLSNWRHHRRGMLSQEIDSWRLGDRPTLSPNVLQAFGSLVERSGSTRDVTADLRAKASGIVSGWPLRRAGRAA